jgi:hypothetical protein
MGSSLHEKIYLGRRASVLGSKRMRALMLVGAFAGIGLAWLAIRTLQ